MTRQQCDYLFYNGSKIPVFNDILEAYFNRFPGRKFKTDFLITSLWRGYFSEFEIAGRELRIRTVKRYIGFDKTKQEFLTEDITSKSFPDSLKLDFFSGMIRISDYAAEQQNQLVRLLKIKNGILEEELEMSGTDFDELKKTDLRIY